MSSRNYLDYVEDILQAIEKAQTFAAGMDYDAFAADEKTVFAVIRALEIVGEAANKIPPEFRVQYGNVPWREMAGIRDKLIHDYFGVNLVVWKTVQEDLPLLRTALLAIPRS